MKILEHDIYLDPLTDLPNFFKFIESDISSMCDQEGSIIILDMKKFSAVNEHHGREVGDICLKTLADTIRMNLFRYQEKSIFRTDGDEFTLILPNVLCLEAKEVVLQIEADFKNIMLQYGAVDISLHNFIFEYEGSIASIDKFYELLFENSFKIVLNNKKKCTEDKWMQQIIGSFTRRIKETLFYLNAAYQLALTDDVSEISNHRAALLYLANVIKEKQEFSILFIDGDNLRRYNKISYQAGNEIIKQLATMITNSLRKNDKVFRWLSGDEFLVILENASYNNAYELGERIRASVEKQTKKLKYPVTLSIGVANYPTDDKTIEGIIDKAEKANSFAKNSGKNRVLKWKDLQ